MPEVETAQTEAAASTELTRVEQAITVLPRLEAIRQPIPGDNPCGRDVTYDEDFLAIKAEVDKIGTVSARVDQERAAELRQMMDDVRGKIRKSEKKAGAKELSERASVVSTTGRPDYQVVQENALRILTGKSKDIRAGSYLCFAMWHNEGFSGFAEGLSAIDILVGEFWDGLYPNRVQGRKTMLESFLVTKMGDAIEYADVKVQDQEPLARAREILSSLQGRFRELMPDSPPSLLGLTQAVEKCLRRVPRPPAPQGVPSAPTPGGSGPAAVSGPALPPGSSEVRTSQEATDLLKKVARFMREHDRKSPTPYRLIRSLRWDGMNAAPPNENGRTKIEPPALQRRNYLAGLHDSGDWAKLLDECETSFGNPGFHLWLDMQRLIVAALNGLGHEFGAVRDAILVELALFLRRVPGITSLSFSDGTGFADAATSDWCDENVAPVLGGIEGGGGSPGLRFDDPEFQSHFGEAKKLLGSGDLSGAISVLRSGLTTDTSRKHAFRRKLAIAALCMRGNQVLIARPLLEELNNDVERFSIDEWEPAMALDMWGTLYRCYASLASGPSTPDKQVIRQQAEKVFDRICRLDVQYAMAHSAVKAQAGRTPPKRKPPQTTAGKKVEAQEKTDGQGEKAGEKTKRNSQLQS
jgi:type VI secretion system protein VasJ